MSVPLYKKIAQDIVDQITGGHLREGDWVSSESELMKKYFVSSITARNALNELVDQGVIMRVRGKGSFVTASPLIPPPPADRVSLCAIFPTMTALVEQSYLYHLEQICNSQANTDLSIWCSHESPQAENKIINDAIEEGIQGILLFPTVDEIDATAIYSLIDQHFPTVLIDRYLFDSPVSSVTSDNYQGAYLATTHLLDLAGPSSAILHFPLYNSAIIDRYRGFCQVYKDRSCPITAINECFIDDSAFLGKSNQERIECIHPIISEHFRHFPGFRGIFATNAEIAQIAYYTAIQFGFTPGKDFQIVSFDNPHLPGVHYISQDFHQIMSCAVDTLQACVKGETDIVHREIPVRLVTVDLHPTQSDQLSHLVMGVGR